MCWPGTIGATAARSTSTQTRPGPSRRSKRSRGAAKRTGYRRFAADCSRVHALLKDTFIDATRPNPVSPFPADRSVEGRRALRPQAVFNALGPHSMTILRTRGSSSCSPAMPPTADHPPTSRRATLMLIAHVEQEGVWIAKHGMHALAKRLAALATGLGANFRNGTPVDAILADASGRRVAGVRLADGEVVPASHVIFNGDVAALPGSAFKP